MLKPFKSLAPYFRRYRWRFASGIIFVLFANFFSVQVPAVVGDAINTMSTRSSLANDLLLIGTYIFALAGLGGAFRYLMRRILVDTSRDIEFDYRNDIYGHLQKMDPSFYDENSTGDIMSRMTNDIDMVRMMIGPAIMYTANSVFTLPLVVFMMLSQDWFTSVAAFAPLVVLPFIVKYFGSGLHLRSRDQQEQMSELTTYVQESLAGVRLIKAYGQEDSKSEGFSEENKLYIDKSMELTKLQALFFPSIRFVAGFGMLAILGAAAYRINQGVIQAGELMSLIILYGMLIWPLIAAGWVINIFQRAAAAIERIDSILNVEPEIKDNDNVVDVVPTHHGIEINDLTFTYAGSDYPALQNVSLSVPPGQTVGIVGRVGSGKSTLVNMLLRLYPVERGKITIGGVDINDWPVEKLRETVGMVFQETFLFSESIADNVRFGALSEMTDAEVQKAAQKADVHKDIKDFPKQYETELGERGINLSGGQKQRLSIARALVRNASVLILDDSLSAVDTHTEETILKSLRSEIDGDRSIFLISHRISTVAIADQIIVLEDGAITQRGNHEQLVAQEGLYAELYAKQLLEEEVEGIA